MADGEEWVEDMKDATQIADNVLDAGSNIGKLISKVLPKHRQCFVQIKNESSNYILCNPRVHTDTGICAKPLAITINPSSSGEGFFTKSTVRGSGGIFTYDLYDDQEEEYVGKMAALYKVPYDLNLKPIVFAVGVFDMEIECDKYLFHSMFKGVQNTFVRAKADGSCITFKNDSVTISANMSNCGKAVMNIEVK